VPAIPTDQRQVAIVARDLMTTSRIVAAAEAAGYVTRRVDQPGDLPAPSEVAVVIVDWAERQPGWAAALQAWRGTAGRSAEDAAPRILLFGPHTDLEAHREARGAGLGPMMARSRLFTSLPSLLEP
jgi:hypothetical protein